MRINHRGNRPLDVLAMQVLLAGTQRCARPGRLRRHDATQAAVLLQPQRIPRGRGVLGRLAGLVRMVATWSEHWRVTDALSAMSDRELADIGLSRSEIGRVFDPKFIPESVRARVRREAAII